MQITQVSAVPMSAPVPQEKRHCTDLGTKVKSDATLIRVETDAGLALGSRLSSRTSLHRSVIGEDPICSERIYEKMYNGSRSTPALERGVAQADESRRRGASWKRSPALTSRVGRQGAVPLYDGDRSGGEAQYFPGLSCLKFARSYSEARDNATMPKDCLNLRIRLAQGIGGSVSPLKGKWQ